MRPGPGVGFRAFESTDWRRHPAPRRQLATGPRPSPGNTSASTRPDQSLIDRLDAGRLQPFEMLPHVLELFGRMALPFQDFAEDAQRGLRAIGFGRVAGEFLVCEIGVVDKGAGGFDLVDALAPVTLGQLGTPGRGFERGGEIGPARLLAAAVIRAVAGADQIAGAQIGAGAVIERRRGVGGVGQGASPCWLGKA